jgi:hypothetical protein
MKIAKKDLDSNPPLIIYEVDGTIETKTLTKGLTIEEAIEIMGGYLEKFQEDLIYFYFADEDGLSKELTLNKNFPSIVGKVLAIPKEHFKFK